MFNEVILMKERGVLCLFYSIYTPHLSNNCILLPPANKVARWLYFHMCLSVHRGTEPYPTGPIPQGPYPLGP